MKKFILAIDQGTSGTKAVIFDTQGEVICKHTESLKSIYPQTGFVEQDPDAIYKTVIDAVKKCYSDFQSKFPEGDYRLSCCGISNQRETFVLWDAEGKPLHNAVVWQCKRSVDICTEMEEMGLQQTINEKTGLLIDPYFSASKVIWLYRNNLKIKEAIDSGNAFFGTVDSWLLYKLTDGKVFATDHTNASRTLFYNIYDLKWDKELLETFGLTGLKLPEVKASAHQYDSSDFEGIFSASLPITAMVGDSHAAYFGEACFEKDMAKATLGTGSSILWNAGNRPQRGEHSIVTTIGWSTAQGVSYAYEGLIVTAGATLEWLRNQLHLFENHTEIEPMATSLSDNDGVYIIPAFSGMGAPYWQKDRKASIHGLTFGTTKNHLVRAGLESIVYQIKDVISAIESEKGASLKELKVDGGMTANTFLMQYLSDSLGVDVVNIGITDVSAYGAALIAGLGMGVWQNTSEIASLRKGDEQTFRPGLFPSEVVAQNYEAWQKHIEAK